MGAFLAARPEGVLGNYIHIHIRRDGTGTIERSRIPAYQTYFAEDRQRAIVASRASIAAAAFAGSTRFELDAEYVRSVASMSIVGHYGSAFRRVRFLGVDEHLSVGPEGLVIRSTRPPVVIDPIATEEYRSRPDRYWDRTAELLKSSLGMLDLTDDELDFPLSGGMDSRLLLASILASGRRARLSGAYTTGPVSSPEVRSAADVCQVLGLPHRNVDRTAVSRPRSIILADKLLSHIAVTEGEMSPLDLTMDMTWRREPRDRTVLMGQEAGLKNIAAGAAFARRASVEAWFDRHLGHGDVLESLHPTARKANVRDVQVFLDDMESVDVPWSDVPQMHRIRYRTGRWAGRLWRAGNALGYAPFVLMTPEIVARSINAGAASRSHQEFYFEVMRRLDSRLVEVPFCEQQWPDATYRSRTGPASPPAPYRWPRSISHSVRRPTTHAIYDNIEPLKAYLRMHAGPVTRSVVDFERLSRLSAKTLKPGHYQPLWQLVQCVLLEKVADLRLLSDRGAAITELPPVDVIGARA